MNDTTSGGEGEIGVDILMVMKKYFRSRMNDMTSGGEGEIGVDMLMVMKLSS